MRNEYGKQLAELSRELIKMGGMCEEAIEIIFRDLSTGSREEVKMVSRISAAISRQERDIEALCLKLLLQQQPVAGDLRQISAALKMITDLDRIGVQASNIAEIVSAMPEAAEIESPSIQKMAETVKKMVTDSITAYVMQSAKSAREVIACDDVVDSNFDAAKKSLIKRIALHPEQGEAALDLLMIAKYLERIGDHAVNTAQWVLFYLTGVHYEVGQ